MLIRLLYKCALQQNGGFQSDFEYSIIRYMIHVSTYDMCGFQIQLKTTKLCKFKKTWGQVLKGISVGKTVNIS